MALHPVKFICNNAEVRSSWGYGYTADLFHCLDKDHIMDNRADPADPLCKEHDFLPGTPFHNPLDPFLHVPELDFGTDDPFPFCLAFEAGRFLKTGMNPVSYTHLTLP